MSNELPFRVQASSSASMPEPAGGVIPPYSAESERGPVASGGEWPTTGEAMSAPAGSGLQFREGFNASGSPGPLVEDFTQRAPNAPGEK